MKSFDVIVLGGGPAGAATAMALLKHGYSVLIVERSHYEDWRVGETLPPHACMPLATLDVWDHFLRDGHLSSPATYAAWGSDELYPTHFIFNPYGPGWHLDRRRFDVLLARSAEAAGATLLQNTRALTASYSESHADPCWHLLVKIEDQPLELQASFLVDATGRSCWLARSQARKRIIYDDMLALVGVLTPPPHPAVAAARTNHPESGKQPLDFPLVGSLFHEDTDDANDAHPQASQKMYPVLFVEATENGWWYSAPVPDGSLIVAYITDRVQLADSGLSPNRLWHDRLWGTAHTLARSQGCKIAGDVHVKSASTYILERPVGSGWLAVGDAACTYDPLSAEGITKALRSGLCAAETIHSSLHSDPDALNNYVIELAREFDDYLNQRAQYYRRETRWPASHFWQRRQIVCED